jgi:hypothetical protein
MARLREFPPITLDVDRVTLHRWRWDDPLVEPAGTAEDERRRGDFQPTIATFDVAKGFEGSVSFDRHHGDPIEVHVVAWASKDPLYWTGPMTLGEGDFARFGLPVVGTIVDAS